MSNTDDGLRIARERIAEEARARKGFLDLGRLGLYDLPVELFALRHLRALNLGSGMFHPARDLVLAHSRLAPNQIDAQISRLSVLPDLVELSVAGTDLSTLTGISELGTLQSLDCSDTQIKDVSPLTRMTALQAFYCLRTSASDLSPLAAASALKVLHCGGTQVKRPLAAG
jgi:internalin A